MFLPAIILLQVVIIALLLTIICTRKDRSPRRSADPRFDIHDGIAQ